MTDYDDLDTYDGGSEQDMWVEFDNYNHTSSPDFFDEPDLDNFIDKLNDWN